MPRRPRSPADPYPVPPRRRTRVVGTVLGVVATVAVLGLILHQFQALAELRHGDAQEVTFSGAVAAVEQGKVARLQLDDGSRRATLTLKSGAEVVTAYPEPAG